MDSRQLLNIARDASENAYSPYSNIKVGAALLCKNGNIYTGVNVENSSYGATICAERTAFTKAISEGEREFEKIAIAGSINNLVPCGMCRQFMAEFNSQIEIVYEDENGTLIETNLKELFPNQFSL